MRLAPRSPPAMGHLLLQCICHLLLVSVGGSSLYHRPCSQQHQNMDSSEEHMPRNSKEASTIIAQKAAQEAKMASDSQQPAAMAAAHQVRVQLADKAVQAAKAAEAALAGKEQLVEQLQGEVREAVIVVQEESASLVNSQVNLNAATTSAKQTRMLLETLQKTIKVAQEALSNAETAATGAKQELSEKMDLVEAARNRAEVLSEHLRSAKLDYENTKRAAYSAACAASEARQKVDRDRRSISGESQTANALQEQQQQPEPRPWESNEQGKAIFSK
ncbi:uncharacterized protein CG45076 [Drosophila bipectinata]|uniref:uncharacterized protein CG45076 n=1 Tax=Drosophila bipectinata TaxID=42026 RepID=UPI001C897DAB|nr:uncharacterized protein LOC108128625 [Drosophila bipectinata]